MPRLGIKMSLLAIWTLGIVSAAQAKDPDAFRIGGIFAMSGNAPHYGTVMSRGAQLAIDEINAKGGVDGIKLELVIEDHKSGNTQAAVAGMNRLITIHDTQAVLSSFSGPTVAIAPISEDKGIFVLNGGGVSLKMVGVSKYMFHNRSLATDLAGAIIRRAKELNATKVSQIAQKNEFGDSVIQASNEAAKGLGLAVAGVEQFATDATNIDTQIAKLRTSRPDAVANWPTTPHAGLVVKRMRELGMTQPVLSMEWTPEDTKVAGANPGHVEVVTDYFAPSEDNPMSRRFHDAYKAKYGDTPDFYAANYYEAVYVIAECIRRAKAEGGDYWSGRRLTEALWQNPTFDSVYGKTMTFQKNGVTLKRVGLFQLEGQSLKFLKFIDTSN